MLAGEDGPLFLGDWAAPVFLHFAVPAEVLQPHTPFPLHCWQGQAVVTLVAFTMRRMRLAGAERLSERLLWPFREQRFLNLRTYVSVGGEPGITFLAEWISSWVQVQVGPALYGLPYHWGRHAFDHDPANDGWQGRVVDRSGAGEFGYHVMATPGPFEAAHAGSFAEFVLERHTCFLSRHGRQRFFRIWHEPWPMKAATVEITDDSLLRTMAPWWPTARLIGAHVSPGVKDVWMGRPHRLVDSRGVDGSERRIPANTSSPLRV